jgi:hypothetical protein
MAIRSCAMLLVLAAALAAWGSAGETLYNGIVLPAEWPPKPKDLPYPKPVAPPYIKTPPAVIPIDVGRQLFVDDFLVDASTLTRTHHLPEYYSGNPVLKPDKPWEQRSAMTFSDGVWWDPKDKVFKMWYLAYIHTCMATSKDAIHWEKPALNAEKDNPSSNITPMLNAKGESVHERDSAMVWLDLEATDPAQRFRMTYYRCSVHNCFSADGAAWKNVLPGDDGATESGHPKTWDRSTFFYNPFRKVWVYSFRFHEYVNGLKGARCRRYAEAKDWTVRAEPVDQMGLWTCADEEDKPWPGYDTPTQLYNLDCAPYESLMLGFFSIWHGDAGSKTTPAMQRDAADGRPKLNNVKIGYSRDGFHWSRPDRRPFMPFSDKKGDWNWGNVQSAGGGCLVMGDKLYFYCSGRTGKSGIGSSTGMAVLRRDGFSSMDADEKGGTLTTRPVTFQGNCLYVNVDCPQGELLVEVLDKGGSVISPFTVANCEPVKADKTLQAVTWKGAADLSAVSKKQVRFRFHLKKGSLYAFWVSADESGASNGYVAGGGPGFTTNRDTAGRAAYAAAAAVMGGK